LVSDNLKIIIIHPIDIRFGLFVFMLLVKIWELLGFIDTVEA
jgi:hypothetical protein